MKSKSEKEKNFKDYKEIFSGMTMGILVEANSITVPEATDLRGKLSSQKGFYKVIKNRVAKKAAEGTSFEALADNLIQVRAIVYTFDDATATTKLLTQEVKKNNKFKLIAGVLVSGDRTQVLSPENIIELGNLPGREELISKLLYIMNAPVTNFARTLNEVPSSFVRVLNAIAENKAA